MVPKIACVADLKLGKGRDLIRKVGNKEEEDGLFRDIQWNPVSPVNNGSQTLGCINKVAVSKGTLHKKT